MLVRTFQVVIVVNNPLDSEEDIRDRGSISGSGRSPGGEQGNPLQYSCLENPMAKVSVTLLLQLGRKSHVHAPTRDED